MKKSFADGGWKVVVDELVPFGEVSDWTVILTKVNGRTFVKELGKIAP